MDVIRHLIRWMSTHKFLNFLILAAIASLIYFARERHLRNEGLVTAPIQRGTVVKSVYGIGTVIANRTFQLKLGLTSHINEIYVEEGQSVTKGQRMIHIDNEIFVAPFSGTITYLPYKAGENVFGQLPSLTLVDLSERYILISLEQQGALQVRRGQAARISIDTLRESVMKGQVQSVYSNDNNFLAKIAVENLPREILPGMTADVAIEIDRHEDALLVPTAALDGESVWIRRDGMTGAQKTPVVVGFVDGAMAEIVSGNLHEGDVLIIRKNAEK